MKNKTQKTFPKVGDQLFLQQRTGIFYVDEVRRPYTVIAVTPSCVKIQSCQLIFNGPRYYDTLPDEIKEDPKGDILELHWTPSKGMWQVDEHHTGYPSFAHFGYWDYYPYLN